jgi:hypothetical protein
MWVMSNKKILIFSLIFVAITLSGYCQDAPPDTAKLLSQVTDIAKESRADKGMMGSFSPGVLFAGIVFGMVGLAAFGYGKKSAKYRPMFIGIVLMVYPYFVANLFALYLIGIVLTVLLFYPPER